MKQVTRGALFKWRQTAPELILCAVRWYLRYSLSFRDVEELFAERGLAADHTTIWRWMQCYGPELEQRLRILAQLPNLLSALIIVRKIPVASSCGRRAIPLMLIDDLDGDPETLPSVNSLRELLANN